MVALASQTSVTGQKKDLEDLSSDNGSSNNSIPQPPEDKYKFIYWMVLYWGEAIALKFTVFILKMCLLITQELLLLCHGIL